MISTTTEEKKDKGSNYEVRRIRVRGISESRQRDYELRKVQESGSVNQTKEGYINRYFIISVPKSYIRKYKIKQSDLFAWSVVKEQPLTFVLKKINTGDNS